MYNIQFLWESFFGVVKGATSIIQGLYGNGGMNSTIRIPEIDPGLLYKIINPSSIDRCNENVQLEDNVRLKDRYTKTGRKKY